ncbi:HAD family hydrolase (plasmid) [Streptomyces sp. NBC_01351]|uniref:HAD family hydrolase n=1 Tax=Streptomyces sp. NBC_01351 TaxID=2903833 RepID=UPI002E371663|nr:HAD family hydrolase [Streptomyces sp. NBC_01351]
MHRLAIFDLDDTLIDRRSAVGSAVASLCLARDYEPAVEQWLRAELADRANPADFARLSTVFRLQEPAEELWQEYVDLMGAFAACRPTVLEGLAQLRAAAWTIGIATNGPSDIQRAKLAATGITELVEGIAVSGDIDARKPDRRLFDLAATRCGRRLSDGGWMIGDNPAGDIEGGRRAGLRTIWIRGRSWPDPLAEPHHAVDDVTDAIAILLNELPE